MKRIAVVQSNYLPWKGYFDLINLSDHFVLYDDVQFNKYNWRNRNRIKTPAGTQWITIPVIQKPLKQKIQNVQLANQIWKRKHWRAVMQNYSQAEYFREYRDFFEELFLGTAETYLSRVNYRFLKAICGLLGIRTEISFSGDYRLLGGRIERVVDLCSQLGADEFLSGPTARPYINEPLFTAAGIKVVWMDYEGYPQYKQLFCPPFVHEVSIIDLILNEGADQSRKFLKSFGRDRKAAWCSESDKLKG